MIKFFTYIFVFYAMKFSPRFIDHTTPKFWRWCVKQLNSHNRDSWVFYRWWRFSVRDMYASPQRNIFAYSRLHPFTFRKL